MNNLEVAIDMFGPARDIAVLRLTGFIDTNTITGLVQALQKVTSRRQYKIIFDLQNVNYISSAGWGIFIGEIREIRDNGGDLKLVGLVPEVEEVYKVLEFDTILKAFKDIDDAVKDF